MNNIRFIHIADTHFGIGKYGKVNSETGLNTRIEEDFLQFDKIINYAVKNKYQLFLIAGDIFDNRVPNGIIQREFAKRLKVLIDNKIITIALMGNHDGTKAIDTAHCLSPIKVLANSKWLYIVDENRVIDFDKYSVACVPYYNHDINLLVKKPNIFLGHLEIQGAHQGKHIFAGGISPLIFKSKKIKYVALGHIHQHQIIGKAVYSGSINRINFGDEGVAKGFIRGELNYCGNGGCKWRFVKLNSRKFLTINGVWGRGVKKLIKKYNVRGKIVKINIEDKKGNAVVPVFNIKNYLSKHGAIVDSVNVLRETKVQVRDKGYRQSKTPKQMLKRYLKGEKQSVIKRGIKILRGAAK